MRILMLISATVGFMLARYVMLMAEASVSEIGGYILHPIK